MDRSGQQRLFDDDLDETIEGHATAVRRGAPKAPVRTRSAGAARAPDIEIRTSRRRRKSATAYWSDGRIVVLLPSHLRGTERTEMVDWLVARVLSRRPGAAASDEALFDRAMHLGRRYVPGADPLSVRWVANQQKRWASCTAETGEIRLSHRLQGVPEWVLDAVLVHELAHLVYPDHSPRFHDLADRFPRQSEAATFLEGYALGLDAGPAVPDESSPG
ncbi:MAG TPA: M48 family metallopeptidase [Acidimicrobiales bacterium]|nr:M48 family metallopeptidase [Acidimicrobiales bacterium]